MGGPLEKYCACRQDAIAGLARATQAVGAPPGCAFRNVVAWPAKPNGVGERPVTLTGSGMKPTVVDGTTQ